MYESDTVTITYADFLLLARIEDAEQATKDWQPSIRVNVAGIWVSDEATDPLLTYEERHVLMRHPDGDTREPIITFPTTLGAIRTRLMPVIGHGLLDPFELADMVTQWCPQAPSKWPWGNHETNTLRALEAAGKQFWANGFDPEKLGDAATNDKVKDWLVENGHVKTKTEGERVARILRPSEVSTGPRPAKCLQPPKPKAGAGNR